MTVRNKFILTPLLILLVFTTSLAQKVKTNSIDKALTEFLESKKVVDNFGHWSQRRDSSIVFVDLNNLLRETTINTWRGYKVTVLKNGELLDSLKLHDADKLLENRCNYYVLMSRKESKKITAITLRHPCTNIVSNVKIIEKNHSFYLSAIENAVW